MAMEFMNESIDALRDAAAEKLLTAGEGLIRWTDSVREAPGRFLWSLETTRPANVAATAALLGGLRVMGLVDKVITDEDRREGVRWVESMKVPGRSPEHVIYRDPAIYDRPPASADNPDEWPTPPIVHGVTRKAQVCLNVYADEPIPPSEPPEGWPQADEPEKAVEFIRTRPWDTNPWGAGSHSMRMAHWLLAWHRDGKIPFDYAVEGIRALYEKQDPVTGLWGVEGKASMNSRINGAFKVFIITQDWLELPIPHRRELADQVLGEMLREDYEDGAGGCDEWDNWYVLAHCALQEPDYRREEIVKLAAHRIVRDLDIFQCDDGGLSFYRDRCCPGWCEYDMAPAIKQGDAISPSLFGPAINCCVDLSDLNGTGAWTGNWHSDKREEPELREKIRAALFG